MIQVILIITLVLGGYFLLVFVGLRMVAPFMGFKQYVPPANLPEEVKQAILELEIKSGDPESYLKNAFNFVLSRWYAVRHKAVTNFPKLFRKDLKAIWHEPGYAHCSTSNFILYTLLANSKFFKASDVKVRHVFVNMIVHQYLQVRVGKTWVNVDPAGAAIKGWGIGKYLRFFG
jgi:hypothetical protein